MTQLLGPGHRWSIMASYLDAWVLAYDGQSDLMQLRMSAAKPKLKEAWFVTPRTTPNCENYTSAPG
jgi:hypothetical protein